MQRLLLDTHVIVWWDDGSTKLGRLAKSTIEKADAVYVSAASEWELTIKAALGKLTRNRAIYEAVIAAGFEPLAVSFQHAQRVGELKKIHGDPFDRLLIATALDEGLTLVSADPVLRDYNVSTIDASR